MATGIKESSVPALEAGISIQTDEQGIATLLIDQPGSKVNVMNVSFIDALEDAISRLAPDLNGLIIASAKVNNFVAGADLEQVLHAADAAEASGQVRRLQRILNQLGALPYPSVAAINGAALGGGLELALACDYRVCVENSGAILGLPEVQLGLLPAGGGTQRLPRLIGLSRALGLILEAKRYTPRRAKRYGVIDEVVHPAVLMDAARRWLARGKRVDHPTWDRLDQLAARWPVVRVFIYRQAGKTVKRKSRGHYPAPVRALDAIRAGQEQGFSAGLAAEAVAFGELLTGPVAHNLINLFFATESLKKDQRTYAAPVAVDRVGVLGAGFMGAGIAQAAAAARYDVRLRDLEAKQVARGLKTARDVTTNAARTGRFSRQEAEAINARLSGSTDYSGFRRAGAVIEAVFESVDIKRAVIAELEQVLAPEALIASNTSSLPIGSLAVGAQHPERIVGMHFFSPVHKMPLLEVVRAEGSSREAIAGAVDIGRRMGKTVIVVADGPGFYTTRVLGFMVQEAGRLFDQGASIEDIDRAMTAFGFPVGPLALTDEVGVEVAAHIAKILSEAFPDRFRATGPIEQMVKEGRMGRKSKSGFYDYSGKKKKPDPGVYALRTAAPQKFPRDLMQRRMVLAFVNEAVRCLDEGILATPRDGDVGAIMGLGFPPFLGGPFRYLDTLGARLVLGQLRQLEYAYGPSFRPAAGLERRAADDTKFYEDAQ